MSNKNKPIVMLGCFDTKAEDFTYLYNCLKNNGASVISINTGVMDTDVFFPIDYDNVTVASQSGTELTAIRTANDRGKAVELMGQGTAKILAKLVSKNAISGVIGMGGGGGTYLALSAMQEVSLGIPKLCLSTIASWDLSKYIGAKDITLMSSVVDVAGLNRISRLLMKQAAAAICSMSVIEMEPTNPDKKTIAISMFGNTTKCVDKCSELLKEKGYEVLVFHATGVGGATMESLIREGVFDAVLDVTTTELADELCGGVLSAGTDRLTAASDMDIPQVVAPGCLDMVNFGFVEDMPEKYKDRLLYKWAPNVTLMRTNEEENEALGKMITEKLNKSNRPVSILIPTKGISQVASEGDIFYNPKADKALFKSLKSTSKAENEVIEVDAHINDEAFALALVDTLLKII